VTLVSLLRATVTRLPGRVGDVIDMPSHTTTDRPEKLVMTRLAYCHGRYASSPSGANPRSDAYPPSHYMSEMIAAATCCLQR
jgi:hypothetical protein